MTMFADQTAGLRAMLALSEASPDLPFAIVASDEVRTPDSYRLGVDVRIHDDLAAFEAWRVALGIDPQSVTRHLHQGDWDVQRLEGFAVWSGVPVRLTGYAPLPAAEGGTS